MVTIKRKGSENLAKSGATAVDEFNLGQGPEGLAKAQVFNLLYDGFTECR